MSAVNRMVEIGVLVDEKDGQEDDFTIRLALEKSLGEWMHMLSELDAADVRVLCMMAIGILKGQEEAV